MSAIASFLWPGALGALREYLDRVPSTVYAGIAPEAYVGNVSNARVESLLSLVSQHEEGEIVAEAAKRARAIAEELQTNARAQAILSGLESRIRDAMRIVAALDAAHAREPLELVALTEDVTLHSKAAAAWAQSNGVPSVVVSHSCILGRLYTIHREANTDTLAVFGARGAQPFTDMGIDPSRIIVTGNPAWDSYPQLVANRDAVRSELAARHEFNKKDHLVVFATTWVAKFTTFCDATAYEDTTRAVLRATRDLRNAGVALRLVVKDRPSNAGQLARLQAIAQEEGAESGVTFAFGDIAPWIAAADAVVSVDSNASIEANIAGVPAINLWSPMSWFNGPFFDADDGVLEVVPEKLAIAIATVLGDSQARSLLRLAARRRLADFTAEPGAAAVRVAELLLRTRKPSAPVMTRYVWEELSSPRSIADKGGTAAYYHNPRMELLQMLDHVPELVLDIGCGGGATGHELKQRFPNATVHGIEMSEEAAAYAVKRLDRVLNDNVEQFDFAAAGYAEGSIDTVFFPDVLEHLYDPWRLLQRIKPYLRQNAQVLASIPNVRNFFLVSDLLRGNWDYVEEGLLDVTHIRFFTRKSVQQLFDQTGYRIRRWGANYDGRLPAGNGAEGARFNLDTPALTVKQISAQDLDEFRTIQFLVDATPV
jgi:trans-aconitate methyltransferase